MPEKRPPPNGRPAPVYPALSRYYRLGAGRPTAALMAEVVEQVVSRLRLAALAADRELVPRYAAALLVEEQSLRELLADAAEITEIELRRQLPADLTFLLHRLVKESDKP